MSFSSQIKKEISMLPINSKSPEGLSELSAILRLNGIYRLGNENILEVQTRNPASASRVYKLIKAYFPETEVTTEIASFRGKKFHRYSVVITKGTDEVLDLLNLDPFSLNKTIPMEFYNTDEKIYAIFRGAFLASGSINDPKTKNYHLELFSNNEFLVRQLQSISEEDFPLKTTNRRDGLVLYIKKTNYIVDFLEKIGANQGRLDFERVTQTNQLINQANRMANVDTFNQLRTLSASSKQIEQINALIAKVGKNSLPEKLREIALLRIENPDASLTELGELSKEKISKSGVSHRLKKIESMYKEMFDLS